MAVRVNRTERYVQVKMHRGPKGEPLKFEDLTDEQKDALALKFQDLTDEQKAELKGDPFRYEDFTPQQIENLKVKGDPGPSPYQVAVADGFVGTEAEWLASLKGERGDMPTEEINAFLSNFYDPSIVALNARAENVERKLRFVQDELDALEIQPSIYTTMATTSPGKLQSVLPSSGSGDFTVERNSEATYVDKDGLVKTAPPNVPRIDWSTGEPMLLPEGSSTNLIPYSVPLSGGGKWTIYTNSSEIIEITNSTISPEGTLAATKIIGTGTGSRLYRTQIPVTPNTDYTISIWLKGEVGGEQMRIAFVDNRSSGAFGPILYLTTEWQRYTFTGQTPNDTAGLQIRDLSGVDQTYYVWGAQLEQGSQATSYIPTNGSIATRLADNIYINNAQDLIGQSEGTVFWEVGDLVFSTPTSASVINGLTSRTGISGAYGVGFANRGNNTFRLRAGGTQITSETEAIGTNKVAITYSQSGIRFFLNGELIHASNEILNMQDITGIALQANVIFNISKFALYKQALTDAQLISLTTL